LGFLAGAFFFGVRADFFGWEDDFLDLGLGGRTGSTAAGEASAISMPKTSDRFASKVESPLVPAMAVEAARVMSSV
jgi:hypothetical protein